MSLSQGQLRELNTTLRQQRARLRDELLSRLESSDDASLQNVAGQVRDWGDESLASTVAEHNLMLADRLGDEINAVEDALNEIDQGEYGRCGGCGSDIAFERLRAEPTAKLCIQCQKTQERLQAETESPTL